MKLLPQANRLLGLFLLLAPLVTAFATSAPEQAAELYQQTKYQQALDLLQPIAKKSPSVSALMGKCYYRLEKFKKATEALEEAVAGDQNNSHYVNWLGKAFGRRAETSSFFTAPSYASTARKYFERAVELDPENIEAVEDLFEYYLEAPGFLGGGQDKAAALLERIHQRAPAKHHSMQARLAEKKKQFEEAEKHWRLAIEAAPSDAGRVIALAKFLARQDRFEESEQAFERAEQMDPESPKLKFERAKTYIESKRNPEQARRLLQEYLQSSLTPDDPPRSEAQQLLEKVSRG